MEGAVAAGLAVITFILLAGLAQAAPMRSYYTLTVIIHDDSPMYTFEFSLDSPFPEGDNATMARTITIDATLGSELVPTGIEYGTCAGSTCNAVQRNATGDKWFNLTADVSEPAKAEMAANPSLPFFANLTAVIVYTDLDDARPRTIRRTLSIQLNYVPPPNGGLLPAAFAGLGSAGVLGLALYAGGRVRLRELYLMHDSGMLIRHWSRRSGPVHDTDIMSGMFIVLQEFVRDSFADRQNALEHLRFGRQQVIMVRGDHTWLAAVVRGRYLSGLPRRLEEAVRDFERHYEDVLRNWNGNVSLFPSVDIVALRFMKGQSIGSGTAS